MSELILSKTDLEGLFAFCENDALKAKAALRLSKLKLPGKKTEHYRYFSIDRILSKSYTLFKPYIAEIKESEDVVIENGVLLSKPKNLEISLCDADFVDDEHFDNVYYVNHLLSKKAIKLDIKESMSLKIRHIFNKENSLIPYRIFINVDSGVEFELYEVFEGAEAKESLVFYGLDVNVGERDRFDWIRVQDIETPSYLMIASHRVFVKDGGKFDIKSFDIGEGHIAHNLKADLMRGSNANAKHLIYTDKNAIRANITQLVHKEVEVEVSQDARHVLKDNSTAIFDAIVKIEKDAKKAIAHQNNRSILLNDKAYMVSKPQLEIYTDELEASHGSTTGTIEEEEIFYMRSRGIDRKKARKMIIFGFMKELIDSVEDERIKEDILERFERIYERDDI